MIDIDVLRAELIGRWLPEGSQTVDGYQAYLTADVLESPVLPSGVLHPLSMFIAGMCGVGYSVQDLFDLAGCPAEDGPMIGETDVRHYRSLLVGEQVAVRTQVIDVARKSGRSGVFDLVRIEHTMFDSSGEAVGAVSNIHVFPRKG